MKSRHAAAVECLERFVYLGKPQNFGDPTEDTLVPAYKGDLDIEVLIPLDLLREAQRVVQEWHDAHEHPIEKKRVRCKTCGNSIFYQNIDSAGRCSHCEDEMRLYLLTNPDQFKVKKSKKLKQATEDVSVDLVEKLRMMHDDDIENFINSLSNKDAQFVRSLLKKL